MVLAPNTTKLGIRVFDQALGGIYLHKPTIICGRRKSGKFVVARQMMAKTLLAGDKIVLFTAKTPEEVLCSVPSNVVDLGEAVESGQLVICPYSAMERQDTGPFAPLPFPQALDELGSLVRENSITYAIFDTIVPWTAIQPVEDVQEHVDTFLFTLDSLGLTSLLLLPEPASPASHGLAKALREGCPINIDLASKNFGAEFTMQVTKYQGLHGAAGKLPLKFELDLTPNMGFDALDNPAAKRGIGAIARPSGATGAQKREAAPSFRPFVAGRLVDFVDSKPAAFAAPSPMATPTPPARPATPPARPATFAPPATSATFTPLATSAPFVPLAPPAAPAPPAASAHPAPPSAQRATFSPLVASQPGRSDSAGGPPAETAPSGEEDPFSFANVIDLPEFHHTARPAVRQKQDAPPPPHPQTPPIQFSSVIH